MVHLLVLVQHNDDMDVSGRPCHLLLPLGLAYLENGPELGLSRVLRHLCHSFVSILRHEFIIKVHVILIELNFLLL